jgi:hypothetical protein
LLAVVSASLCGIVAGLTTLVAFGLSAACAEGRAGGWRACGAMAIAAALAAAAPPRTVPPALINLLVPTFLSLLPRRGSKEADAPQKASCAELTEATLFYALWFGAFTSLCAAVARRTGHMRRLLNPVSSGVVAI